MRDFASVPHCAWKMPGENWQHSLRAPLLQFFAKAGITVAMLSTMSAMEIMEQGLVVISQLETLMHALRNL
jgi:hypothetical protein